MNSKNIPEMFLEQAKRNGPNVFMRHRKWGTYRDLSWKEILEQSLGVASSLIERGIQAGDRVGVFAENRYEWVVADLGLLFAGGIDVPPHCSLTPAQVAYQLEDSGAKWVFVSTAEQLKKVQAVRKELPELRGVVPFEKCSEEGAGIIPWRDFLHHGRENFSKNEGEIQKRVGNLQKDSLATIMYTSGTTGNPKGVMLTHHNLLSNVEATFQAYPRDAGKIVLNWLPFSHIYARTVDYYLAIFSGAVLPLAQSAETLVQDLMTIRPHFMSCVPRFYEKLMASVSYGGPEGKAKGLKKVLGDRIGWLSSGGAPLPYPIALEYQKGGYTILQGYGLTETSPVMTFNRPDCYKLDTVGKPIEGVEVKISAEGEILTKGPQVMVGYWNNPLATEEAIREGWFYTGDLGEIDSEGFLKITGRKKELLVLSNGKKVVPSFIEGLVISDPMVEQTVVNGEGRNFLTALVVPNWAHFTKVLGEEFPEKQNWNREEICQSKEVVEYFQKRIEQKLEGVSPWEKIRKIMLLGEPFSEDQEELTVSLKLRRNVILKKYQKELDRLYQEDKGDWGGAG